MTAERDQLAAEKAELQDRLLRAPGRVRKFPPPRRTRALRLSAIRRHGPGAGLLPILDDFERALKTETADREYAKGMELIYQRLFDTLKKLGLEPIETAGKPFDPNVHQAVRERGDRRGRRPYRAGRIPARL